MKKITFILMTLALLALPAAAQEPPPGEGGQPTPPPDGQDVPAPLPSPEEMVAALAQVVQAQAAAQRLDSNASPTSVVIQPATDRPAARAEVQATFIPPAQPLGTIQTNGIVMNFKNAPLEMVLHYLSDAAGFIIVLETRVNGNVNVISNHPMTRDEAVDLLNSVLNKNGYGIIRNGRTLTIVDKNDAKTRGIPVKSGNVPDRIPNNAEIVTQIIPIRFVEARQLVSDLTSFVSPQATVVANEAGNAIVITDTQSNIRHLMEIIRAIDDSAQSETEIRVFRLKHASPADVATELASIFPSGSGTGAQSPTRFGGSSGRGSSSGGRSSFFAAMMGGGGGSGNSSDDRVKKASQVTAVPDPRIQAVIVTAPKDLMEQIAAMMNDLDVPSTRDQKVYVFKMDNGDPQQAAQVLQGMFQNGNSQRSGSGSSQNSALMQRAQNNATQSGSSSSSSSSMGANSGSRRTGGSQF